MFTEFSPSLKSATALVVTTFLTATGLQATPPPAFHLTFDEEFNSLSLWNGDNIYAGSSGTWKPYYPKDVGDPWCLNNEEELYISPTFPGFGGSTALNLNPFSVSSGVLSITSDTVTDSVLPADVPLFTNSSDYLHSTNPYTYNYTSGLLTSQSRSGYGYIQTYGYFEMRAQLPMGAGLWPAFWLLPQDGANNTTNWNYELDIVEAFGKHNGSGGGANQVHYNTITSGPGGGGWATIPGSIYAGYHTYGLNWQSDYCTYYVDGVQIGQTPSPIETASPVLMLVNVAMGGSWAGPVDTSALPAQMKVDYIRVYSSNAAIAAATPQANYDANTAGMPLLVAGKAASVVTLSTQGLADWSHWGGTSTNNTLVWDHKSGLATPLISNYTVAGGGTAVAYGSNPSAFDWTGSAGPDATSTDTAGHGTGISNSVLNGGFYFGVTTGIVPRILNVYVGANNAGGQLQIFNSTWTALFNDTSIVDGTGGGANTVYTIDLPANATYYVQWTKISGTGSVTLQGAALTSGPNTAGPATGNYSLTPSTLTGFRMDAWNSGGTGTKVDMNAPNGTGAQVWTLTNLGGNLYEISPSYNTTLAVAASGTGSGSTLSLATYTGASSQQWTFISDLYGNFALSPLSSATQLASAPNSGVNGTQLVTYATSSSYAQLWTVTPVTNAAPPTFSVPTLTSEVLQFPVTLNSTTPSATIYYTTDGSIPTTASASIASGSSVTITQSETLNAMAGAIGYNLSSVGTAVYQVTGALSGGDNNTLALKSDGSVWIWGGGATSTPAPVSGLTGVISVASAHGNQFAVKSDGTLWAWGSNSFGQFGNGNKSSSSTPIKITTVSNVTEVAAGEYATYVRESDGSIWTTSGNGTTPATTNFVPLLTSSGGSNFSGAAHVYGGCYDAYIVKTDGTLWAWGRNTEGEMGNGTSGSTSLVYPVQATITGVSTEPGSVASSTYSVAAIKSDGTVWSWGSNSYGQLGNGSTSGSATPVQALTVANVTGIASSPGAYHVVAVQTNGSVYTWGLNSSGQLGDGTTTNRTSPVLVQASSGVNFTGGIIVGAGANHSVMTKTGVVVWCVGSNSNGQLGNGTTTSSSYPVHTTGTFVLALLKSWWHTLGLDRLFALQPSLPAKVAGA